jgi:hypothetical protein
MTTSRFGATPEEWSHFSNVLGLTADLLPVVSNPHAVIAPHSSLSSLGKIPSLYNPERQVVGIRNWPNHLATPEDIARWSEEPDYGICIITRTIRALDVDVTDSGSAEQIRAFLREQGCNFPERIRNDSPKFLQMFRLSGHLPKRVMPVAGGVIEFLATGQQFIACGTHPSGSRYEWKGGLPWL